MPFEKHNAPASPIVQRKGGFLVLKRVEHGHRLIVASPLGQRIGVFGTVVVGDVGARLLDAFLRLLVIDLTLLSGAAAIVAAGSENRRGEREGGDRAADEDGCNPGGC